MCIIGRCDEHHRLLPRRAECAVRNGNGRVKCLPTERTRNQPPSCAMWIGFPQGSLNEAGFDLSARGAVAHATATCVFEVWSPDVGFSCVWSRKAKGAELLFCCCNRVMTFLLRDGWRCRSERRTAMFGGDGVRISNERVPSLVLEGGPPKLVCQR